MSHCTGRPYYPYVRGQRDVRDGRKKADLTILFHI